MIKLEKHVRFVSGSPQFRITESKDKQAPVYWIYSQSDLMEDLTGVEVSWGESKEIRTRDEVATIFAGDIVFSLISGSACIVSKNHEGYLCTQNYVRLFTNGAVEPSFLVYLLNEDSRVKRQLQMGLQGSSILKYTVKQLRELVLPPFPSKERQIMIGGIYLKQLKLEALKKRVAEGEKKLLLHRLEGICYERSDF